MSLDSDARRAAAAKAWSEYLLETRRLPAHRYEEIEPFAWRRLQARLREIVLRFAEAGVQ